MVQAAKIIGIGLAATGLIEARVDIAIEVLSATLILAVTTKSFLVRQFCFAFLNLISMLTLIMVLLEVIFGIKVWSCLWDKDTIRFLFVVTGFFNFFYDFDFLFMSDYPFDYLSHEWEFELVADDISLFAEGQNPYNLMDLFSSSDLQVKDFTHEWDLTERANPKSGESNSALLEQTEFQKKIHSETKSLPSSTSDPTSLGKKLVDKKDNVKKK